MDKKVYVVLVTYNGSHWIDKNITSLLNSTHPVNIIAIDNNSSDESVTLLQKYPQVSLILPGSNLGFGKGNNIGIRKALEEGADYVFLLNQDAWVFPDTVGRLVDKMEADKTFGIMSPFHLSGDGITPDKSFEIYLSRNISESAGVAIVPFVNAAAWMLSRACVGKTGYFEPLYGHYGEDRNYCDRVRYHKFLIGIDRGSVICHDRIITRNLNKDIIQSKYKVLTALLDINNGILSSYWNGLKEVAGLPKYFSRFYRFSQVAAMFFKLSVYYLGWLLNFGKIIRARENAM